MAFANGKEVQALYLGGERYHKSDIGLNFKFTKIENPISTYLSGGDAKPANVGETFPIVGEFTDLDNKKVFVLKVSRNGSKSLAYEVENEFGTKIGGGKLARLYTMVKRFVARKAVIAWL